MNISFFITYIFGESFRKLEVLNNFFEFEEKNDVGFNIIKKNYTHTFNYSSFIIQKPKQKNKLKIKKNNKFKTAINNSKYEKKIQENILKNSNIKENNNIYIYGINNINYKINNTNQSNSKLIDNRRSSLPLTNSNTLIIHNNNNNFIRANLTLKTIIKENIKIYCFFCCSNRKNYKQYFNIKHANLLQYYYIKLIQINRYLKNVQEFDFLKKIFLNNYQIKSLFFLRRINLTKKKERN